MGFQGLGKLNQAGFIGDGEERATDRFRTVHNKPILCSQALDIVDLPLEIVTR
jgi:hypothetical protein